MEYKIFFRLFPDRSNFSEKFPEFSLTFFNFPFFSRFTLDPTYVIVADDAFPLRVNIMKPYPFRGLPQWKIIFNYRPCRARRIVENAFGILANRFRVFLSPMLLSPENVERVALASCVLHNFLRDNSPARYSQPGKFDTECLDNGVINAGGWHSSEGNVTGMSPLPQCLFA